MSDQNKFEKMLELLVNEDKAAAQELFHEIVVEKSRDIYESLLEDEDDIEEATDEEVDESDEDLDEAADEDEEDDSEEVEENFDLDTFEVEADDDMGGDPTDDMMADLGMDDEGGEEGEEGEGDVEDRVEDLEDALEDLKAEFEKMMAGDEGDDEGDMDAEEEPEEESFAFEASDEEVEEAADEEVEEAADEEVEETEKSASETMREYVEKVNATMGDNGANTKSAVAKPNNMGGTAANLAQGADEKGGKAAGPKEDNAGNVNVPGAKASKSMASNAKGHGAEKKGAGETADNKKSVVGK